MSASPVASHFHQTLPDQVGVTTMSPLNPRRPPPTATFAPINNGPAQVEVVG